MDKENLIELVNKLYKLTLLFPKKEPLRYKMREVADEILDGFVSWEALRDSNTGNSAANWESQPKDLVFLLDKNLGVLKAYFEVAKWQNWVNYFDVLEIEEEYDKIKCELERKIKGLEVEKTAILPGFDKINQGQSPETKTIDAFEEEGQNSLGLRKDKILEFLKEKGQVQVWQAKEVFPEVSKRTLRRDFEKLLKQGIIERMGERNNTFYQLKEEV